MAKTVLITGGAGFIGSHIARSLSGAKLIVLDNLQTGARKNVEGIEAEFIKADCTDIPSLGLAGKGITEIYHLGMPSSSPLYKDDHNLVGYAINGSICVFDLAKDCRAKVVYASSSSLYNGIDPPHREDMPIKVTDYYTEARYGVERMARLYHTLYGVQSIGLRLFSVYGPGENSKGKLANIISQFLWSMQANEQPLIYGGGEQTRDFTYVKDVARAFRLAMASSIECDVFNIGTGQMTSFNQVVARLAQQLGVSIDAKRIENPIKNYVGYTQADTSKARKALGFQAEYSLEQGIRELIKSA
ncbi:MAG: NAD-dependent epimerase/dehydratase family protein [Candidatus Aenigmarchaeota archaeon]|nr:NAD-dependent epimerase/dehydratase family protein [Candidatus Aenigmarchaeota archaeon]